MRVVAHAALLEHVLGMRMLGAELRVRVAGKAVPLEPKPSTLIEPMALRAVDAVRRRMHPERLEACRSVLADVDAHLLPPAGPDQRQSMLTWRGRDAGVKHIGERLFGLDRLAVGLSRPSAPSRPRQSAPPRSPLRRWAA